MVIFCRNTSGEGLFADCGGEVDFVVGRSDAGREDGDEVGGLAVEFLRHSLDGLTGDVGFSSFFSGVEEGDRFASLVDEINRSTVGDVNTKEGSPPVADQSVGPVGDQWGVRSNGDDFRAMNLFGEVGGGVAQIQCGERMVGEEVRKGFLLVGRGGDARDPFHEISADTLDIYQGVQKERRFLHARSVAEASLLRQVSKAAIRKFFLNGGPCQ